MKVWRDLEPCPFCAGSGPPSPLEDETEEELAQLQEEEEAARQLALEAAQVAVAASKEPLKGQEPEDRPVRSGGDELAALRKKCRNTLCVAATILSQEELQTTCRLLFTFCTPRTTSTALLLPTPVDPRRCGSTTPSKRREPTCRPTPGPLRCSTTCPPWGLWGLKRSFPPS